MRVIFLFVVAMAFGQRFPMRQAGSIRHPGDPAEIDLGIAKVRGASDASVRIGGKDKHGAPWSVSFDAVNGAGQTEIWIADFDADGQKDLLVGRTFSGVGWCVNWTDILLLLFDGHGRPVPWSASTSRDFQEAADSRPLIVKDANRNGRAEFVLTDCHRGNNGEIRRQVEAFEASVDKLLQPQTAPASEIVEQLIATDQGGWQILLSNRQSLEWTDQLIVDGPEGREIIIDQSPAPITRVMRYGYRVQMSRGWLWADAYQPPAPAKVQAELVVSSSKRQPASFLEGNDGCFDIHYPGDNNPMTIRTCPGHGIRALTRGGRAEEYLPDRFSLRVSNSAMGVTHTFDTKYERPPGATTLMAVAGASRGDLTQWIQPRGGRLFALHAGDGSLMAAQVQVPVDGDLLASDRSLAFVTWLRGMPAQVVEVRGRIRWIRK
ncbi:MAG: VCBS repeat-containing protein [Bryobacteraceae bacterium]